MTFGMRGQKMLLIRSGWMEDEDVLKPDKLNNSETVTVTAVMKFTGVMFVYKYHTETDVERILQKQSDRIADTLTKW